MTMFLAGKRLLLAGGTGLVGGGVLRQVLSVASNVRIRIPHRGGAGAFLNDPRVEYVKADLTRSEDCARVAVGCECAVLAAAQTGGAKQAKERPWEQVTENLVMDARLLEVLARAGVRRIAYLSSATAYPELSGAIREDQMDWGVDPAPAYFGIGWAKRAAEKLCRFWHETCGTEVLIARLANVYGPNARFDPGASNFVGALVRKAVARDDPFMVWGSPDVGRDILYAEDCGRAVVAMLEAVEIKFDVFNIGSGAVTTVGEVVELALRAVDHTPGKIVYDSTLPTTINHRVLNCSRARDVLGWTPAVTPAEGIRRTVDWWRANKDTWKR
jgi:nucleoside-diphosphate-sugar epimerase